MLRAALIATACLLLLPGSTLARTWYITPDGTGDAPTIQAAMDSAAVSDTVEVACGTYFEHDIIMQRGVTLRSTSSDPNCAIIDAQNTHRVMRLSNSSTSTTIEGITFRNGNGGGLRVSDGLGLRINRCRFEDNVEGSALRLRGGGELSELVFLRNATAYQGGALYTYDADVEISTTSFLHNSATDGGAIFFDEDSEALLESCSFADNAANSGGAVFLEEATNIEFRRCRFVRNTATGGAAITAGLSYGLLWSCDFLDNEASVSGGAMSVYDSDVTIRSCVFLRNQAGEFGGGLSTGTGSTNPRAPTIEGCTFFGNSAPLGGGIASAGGWPMPTVTYSIIAGSTQGEAYYCTGTTWPSVRCSDFYGNAGGDWVGCVEPFEGIDGNFSADPLFCDGDAGNVYLQWGSPCLPANSPEGCGQVGRYGHGGCSSIAVQSDTWGRIKGMYR